MSNQTDEQDFIIIQPDTPGAADLPLVRETFQVHEKLHESRLPFPAAPFNYEAALHDIFAKEDEITQLARAFNDADEKRKKAKLALDQAHEQLSAMIAVIRVREEERREDVEQNAAAVTRLEEDRCAAVANALARREMIMAPEMIASWSWEERLVVYEWAMFNDPGQAPPPMPPWVSTSHVAGPQGVPQHCTQCGATLVSVADCHSEHRTVPEGWFFGTGCPGRPKAEPEPAPRRRKRAAQ